MTEPAACRVLLVEDHPIFLEGLMAAIGADHGFSVVAAAGTADEAVAATRTHAPDLVVMDLGLPGRSGIEAIREVLAAHPEVHVLVMTMSEDDDSLLAAMRAGARGYLLKGASRDEILRALHTVAGGGAVFSPQLAGRIGVLFASVRGTTAAAAFPTLTAREREVLDLLASGLGYGQIARSLFLAEKTVRNHVGSVFAKLRVHDRAEAVVRARDAGLGTVPRPAGQADVQLPPAAT
ncbi:response regulator transcription factor [Streptomyces sp. NPDC051940]|uniref:response regulator transcription factor n=1 Tax=Streptomyces sp. NPDC051940 TaxID=3155675 RepID=UPI00343A61F6